MKGPGIKKRHAVFRLKANGLIDLIVNSQDSYENTLVNGKRLELDPECEDEWYIQLNHLDRICFGNGSIFIFKFPLLETMKEIKMEEIMDGL